MLADYLTMTCSAENSAAIAAVPAEHWNRFRASHTLVVPGIIQRSDADPHFTRLKADIVSSARAGPDAKKPSKLTKK